MADHEETVLKFLYEEGPHTSAEITDHLGLSKDHTATILGNMKNAGLVAKIHTGKPAKPYWLLAEDA